MAFTRNDDRDAFKHVMFTVLDFSTDDEMPRALKREKLDRITHLMSLADEDLMDLKYINAIGEKRHVPYSQIDIIRCFIGYTDDRYHKGDRIKRDEFLTITKGQLE